MSLVLATSAGCAIEDLAGEHGEQPDDLDQSQPAARVVDPGSAPASSGYDAHVPHPAPDNATCQIDPGRPAYFDARIYPPEPGRVDAGVNFADATVPRNCFGALVGDVLYATYECCKSVVLPRPVGAGTEPWLK